MDNGWVILIVVIFVAIIGYMYMTTPYLEVDNFIVEKHIETIEYTSGKVEKDYYVCFNFTITNTKSIRDCSGNLILFDKYGNVLENSTFEFGAMEGEYPFETHVSKEAYENVAKVEVIIFDYNRNSELYHSNSSDFLKGKNNVVEMDDSPVIPSHKSTRDPDDPTWKYEYDYVSEEDRDWYWGYDELGHRVHKPKNAYVPKWGQ